MSISMQISMKITLIFSYPVHNFDVVTTYKFSSSYDVIYKVQNLQTIKKKIIIIFVLFIAFAQIYPILLVIREITYIRNK